MAAAAPAGPPPTTSTSNGSLAFKFCRIAIGGTGIDLGEDFFQRHAAVAEQFTIQVNTAGTAMIWRSFTSSWNSAPSIMVVRRPGSGRHQVECLHHVRAVVAGQRDDRSRNSNRLQRLDLFDHIRLDLGRVAAHLQQGQHQRGEFMPHGQCRQNGRRPSSPTRFTANDGLRTPPHCLRARDFYRSARDVVQQRHHLIRGRRCRPHWPPARSD
jgi:hypothetical protein